MALAPPSTAPALPAGMADVRFAVVDVETSGLRWRRHRVLQMAVVRVRGDGVVLDRWATDVRVPWGRVGPIEVHGITRARMRAAPRFPQVAPALIARLDGNVLVAHNAAFDWGFLRAELGRLGYPTPWALQLDTLRLSRRLDPEGLEAHALADVTARYGMANGHPHDALADADTTAALLVPLLAANAVTTPDELRPHLWGATTDWPAFTTSRRRALRWQLRRLRPRHWMWRRRRGRRGTT